MHFDDLPWKYICEIFSLPWLIFLNTISFWHAKMYGGCVAAKVPEVESDMCLKEFIALKKCMQYMVSYSTLQRDALCSMTEKLC